MSARLRGDGGDARVAVVTGGGTGIGFAAAHALAGSGFNVVIAGRRQDVLETACDKIREVAGARDVSYIPADVGVPADARNVVDAAVERYGRLDCLVVAAGASEGSPFLRTTVEEWDRMLNVNLRAPWICAQAAARHMVDRGQGRIILVGSIAGYASEGADYAHYCAAKAGVHSLTQTFGAELARHGVLVNAIAPGWVDSPMAAEAKQEFEPAAFAQVIPTGRICEPAEVAEMIRYLATESPPSLVATVITLDGGQTALMSVPPRAAAAGAPG